MKGCLPITKMVCDRQDLGSYSVATFSFAIAPQRPRAVIAPALAPLVAQITRLRGAKFAFSSRV